MTWAVTSRATRRSCICTRQTQREVEGSLQRYAKLVLLRQLHLIDRAGLTHLMPCAVLVGLAARRGAGSPRRTDGLSAPSVVRQIGERQNDDTNSALAHSTMGMVRRLQNRLGESRFEFETAIALDPNDTYAHFQLLWVLLYLGDPPGAIRRCETAMRLSPRDPQLWGYHLPLGWCRLLTKEADLAIDQVIRSRALNPRLWHIHFAVAAAQGFAGDVEGAQGALAAIWRLRSEVVSIARYRADRPWGNSRYWELFNETAAVGLRRTGFREE